MEKYCRAGQAFPISQCVSQATHTHTHTHTLSECVLLIASPLQQWLHENTSMLLYMYIAYPVTFFYTFVLQVMDRTIITAKYFSFVYFIKI